MGYDMSWQTCKYCDIRINNHNAGICDKCRIIIKYIKKYDYALFYGNSDLSTIYFNFGNYQEHVVEKNGEFIFINIDYKNNSTSSKNRNKFVVDMKLVKDLKLEFCTYIMTKAEYERQISF